MEDPNSAELSADCFCLDESDNAIYEESSSREPIFLDKRYRVIKLIGEGAGSQVYKAQHRLLDELIAVKVLKHHLLEKESSVERFRAEGRLAMRLSHKNIVRIKGFGLSLHNEPFIIMEYCSGSTLEDVLRRGPLKLIETIELGKQIASALLHAHQLGIIHRDIKPANIMLVDEKSDVESGEPRLCAKLLDFGLAKDLNLEIENQGLTGVNAVLGTPLYMSPEQCRKETLDARADIYSLGCVLFECLTGRKLFQADSELAVMSKHLTEDLSFRSTDYIPASFKLIVAKCLSKNPAKRYQTCADLLNALEELQDLKVARRASVPKALVLITLGALIMVSLSVVAACILSPVKKAKDEVINVKNIRPIQKLRLRQIDLDTRDAQQLIRAARNSLFSAKHRKEDLAEAQMLFQRARVVALRDHDKGLYAAASQELFHMLLSEEDDFAGAKKVADDTFRQHEKLGDKRHLSESYMNFAELADYQKQRTIAVDFCKKALSVDPTLPLMKAREIRRVLTYDLIKAKEFDKALTLALDCKKNLIEAQDYENVEKTFQRIWNDLICTRLHLEFNDSSAAAADLVLLKDDWSMCQNRKRFLEELKRVYRLALEKEQNGVAQELEELLQGFSGSRNADKADLPDEQIYGKLRR